MPAFELDTSTSVDWKNPNDPAVWVITLDGADHKFLLDPDPSLSDAADVDLADDGWIATVAQQVMADIPAAYGDGGYEDRAAFEDVMEAYTAANDFRASHLRAMMAYANDQREAAQKAQVGKKSGGRTPRR